MSKLPALFQEIINHDNALSAAKVISLEEYREWKDRRRVLTQGAERFIKQQRSGTTA